MHPPLINMMNKIILKAAQGLMRDFGEVGSLQNSYKGADRFVTIAHRRTETILHDELHALYPDHNFLLKENEFIDYGGSEAPLWIINPLDGSNNFLHGLPYFSTSIALKNHDQLIASAIYDPLNNELFWAHRGVGSFLNQTRLRVSVRHQLAKSLIAMGVQGMSRSSQSLELFSHIRTQVLGVRMWGNTSLDLAYVAAGRYDGFWEHNARSWDIAAGILLIKESGGFVGDHKGSPASLKIGNIIAGTEIAYHFLLSSTQHLSPEKSI